MFACHLSGKGLIPRIYKELSRLNNKKASNPFFSPNNTILKRGKDLNTHFTRKFVRHRNVVSQGLCRTAVHTLKALELIRVSPLPVCITIAA